MKNECKYPVTMNKYRKNFLQKLRIFHFIFAFILMISAFFPQKYLNYSIILWVSTILINIFFAGDFSHCWIQYFEWRNSNCENYAVIHEIFKILSIDTKYTKHTTRMFYILFVSIILIRSYMYGVTF